MMNNRVREILQGLYLVRGAEICSDARLCRNLLNDLCGDSYTEVRVLTVAVEEGMLKGLAEQLRHQPREGVVSAAAGRLAKKAALRYDAAKWAIESWITALEQQPGFWEEMPEVFELEAERWDVPGEISRQTVAEHSQQTPPAGRRGQKLNSDYSLELVAAGKWLYYVNENDGQCIYRMMRNGSRRHRLNDDRSWGLRIDGEWLYYLNGSDNNCIYRMNLDGENRQKLNDDWSTNITIDGGWLYFNERGCPCKMRPDGSEHQKISDARARALTVEGDWIYYIDRSDGNSIYRVRRSR